MTKGAFRVWAHSRPHGRPCRRPWAGIDGYRGKRGLVVQGHPWGRYGRQDRNGMGSGGGRFDAWGNRVGFQMI